MENLKLAYCNECEDLVKFDIYEELFEEEFKGETISYKFRVGKCKCCNSEVATDIDYNSRKSKAKIEAYKRKIGIIDLNEISEILEKYDIGKENLANIAGFGKVTIKRYYDGFIPSGEYSETLFRILREEEYFMGLVEEHKEKLKDVAYKKIISRYERLAEISSSKIDQIANYIITHIGEVTPLALEKLLSFSNGVNYALNGKQLIFEECQAWAHGPVYPQMYNKYKSFGYKPIDDGIYSTHGCMLSKLSAEEIKAIDLVIGTFGLYSPKILERISHSQEPWKEKRIGYKEDEAGREVIEEASIKMFYTNHELNSEESIMKYIMTCIKNSQ
jgi:uncharacterized phage-associated protein